ncbi:hypothetical protein BJS_08999 [Bradyrhizobium japonicum SEMIA 5079]|nr:hypothetical protein BJS_08999 [Bradyrhizobium japonicum SEMIA 5079]
MPEIDRSSCDQVARWSWSRRDSPSQPLLLDRQRVQAMVEIDGAIPGQHLVEIRLQRAFALPHLLGPALLGRLAPAESVSTT